MSVDDVPFQGMFEWAEAEYKSKQYTNAFGKTKCSLVHERLMSDEGFYHSDGQKLTKLMMRCVDSVLAFRPTMKEVVQSLLELRVVQRYADFMGVKDMLRQKRKLNFFYKIKTCIISYV